MHWSFLVHHTTTHSKKLRKGDHARHCRFTSVADDGEVKAAPIMSCSRPYYFFSLASLGRNLVWPLLQGQLLFLCNGSSVRIDLTSLVAEKMGCAPNAINMFPYRNIRCAISLTANVQAKIRNFWLIYVPSLRDKKLIYTNLQLALTN